MSARDFEDRSGRQRRDRDVTGPTPGKHANTDIFEGGSTPISRIPGKTALSERLEPATFGVGAGTSTNVTGAGAAATGTAAAQRTFTWTTPGFAPGTGDQGRSTVGVGERINFTAQAPGRWTATRARRPDKLHADGSQFEYLAPATAGHVTITFQPAAGGPAETAQFTVVAPTGVEFLRKGELAVPAAGALMVNFVRFTPLTVSFDQAMWLELPSNAEGRTGYFRRGTLPAVAEPFMPHTPADEYLNVNADLNDRAGFQGFPRIGSQWAAGTFHWTIPNYYRVQDTSLNNHLATVTQAFAIAPDGTVTVTKGSQSHTQPGPGAAAAPTASASAAPAATAGRGAATLTPETRTGLQVQRQAVVTAGVAGGVAIPPTVIVEDQGAQVASGQLRKTDFLLKVEPLLREAAKAILGPAADVAGCPYIAKYLALFRDKPAADVEKFVRRYTGSTAQEVQQLLRDVIARVKVGVTVWKETHTLPADVVQADPVAAQAAQYAAPPIQRKADNGQVSGGPSKPAEVLERLGDGAPLDPSTQARMERAFGTSFSDVRIHTDSHGNALAQEHSALAFAVGSHVAFAPGRYQPGSIEGDALLAHELTHVLQQRGATASASKDVSEVGDASEKDADRGAANAVAQLHGGDKASGDKATSNVSSDLQLQRCSSADPAKVEAPQINGDAKVPDPLNVMFGDDLFVVTFGQVGANEKPQLSVDIKYTGAFPIESSNNNARNITLTQPLKQPGPLDVAVKSIGPTGLEVDTIRNDFDIVQVNDHISFSTDKKARQHDFQIKLFGLAGTGGTFWVKDPKAKAVTEDKGPAIQDDKPGQATKTYKTSEHHWQIRLDSDGDQYKESLLEIDVLETHPSRAAKTVELAVTQIDTKTRLVAPKMTLPDSGHQFDFPFLGPTYAGTDGSEPTTVRYASQPVGGPFDNYHLVTISLPVTKGDQSVLTLSQDGYTAALTFPKHEPVKNDKASAPKKLGGFWTTDLELGPYRDRFRMTIEPTADPTQALVVVAAMSRGKPSFALRVPAKLPAAGITSIDVLSHEGVGLQFDLDGDKKPDIELFLGISEVFGFQTPIEPERNRYLDVHLRGPAIGKDARLEFEFFEGDYRTDQHKGNNAEYAKNHENDPIAATTALSNQGQIDTFEKTLDSYEVMMAVARKDARDKKLISNELYEAWKALSSTIVDLEAPIATFKQDPTKPVDATLRATAVKQATALYEQLKHDTPPTTDKVSQLYAGSYEKNRYTGETFNATGYQHNGGGAAKTLPSLFAGANDKAAWNTVLKTYQDVVGGVDRWIIDQTKKEKGDKSPEAQKLDYMSAMQGELAKIQEYNPKPLHAVFYPDPANLEHDREVVQKSPTEVPLSIYYWSTGSDNNQEWHIRDLSNPHNPFEDTFKKGKDEQFPAHEQLQDQLDAKIHFPKGQIFYQFPGGPGNKVITHANKKWYEWVADVALVAAIVGLALVTAGGAVAVAGGWALAVSGLVGAVAAGGDMVDHIEHGNYDATTFALDALQIVTGVVSFGAFGAGRVLVREAAATEAAATGSAAKVAKPPTWLLNMSKQAYLPLRIGGAAGAGVQLLVMTAAAQKQFEDLDKLEARGGDKNEIARAKRQIIANLAIQGGFTILAIKGELPALKEGMDLIVSMKGTTPVAHVEGQLDPRTIKFSQESVSAQTSDGITLPDLQASMQNEGWKGEPIHVVQLEDQSLVSLDNRRLLAARRAVAAGGVKGADGKPGTTIPTEVHSYKEPIDQTWAQDAFIAKKDIYRTSDGALTTEKVEGQQPVIKKGTVARTYGEAATIRAAKQGKIKSEGPNKGKPFPLTGSIDDPRVVPAKPGGKPNGGGGGGNGGGGGGDDGPGGGGGGNDVDFKKPLEVDVNNDAARIQTKSLNGMIQDGEIKLDWNKKNKAGTTTLGAEYRKWIEGPDPVDFSGKTPKANYHGDPEFAPEINAIVENGGNITLNLKAQANANAAKDLKIKSLDPSSPSYAADRAKLVEKFGAEAVARYEQATLGDASDPSRKAIFDQVNKIVGPEAITDLRNAFPKCEIYITGSASQPSKGKPADLMKINDLDVVIVVPEGTDAQGRALIEERAATLSVPTTPEFAAVTKKSSLKVDATARTKDKAFGLMTTQQGINPKTNKPYTPLEYARVDANIPESAQSAKEYTAVRQYADKLAESNPKKMTDAEQKADLDAYMDRKKLVDGMLNDRPAKVVEKDGKWYTESEKGTLRGPYEPDPKNNKTAKDVAEATILKNVTKERLELAAAGDPVTGDRVPLTYGTDPVEAKKLFHQFQDELRAVFDAEGITDAVVVQLGSGTTGWSTAPGKAGKAWTPKSDVDFAIFSDQALEQAMKVGAPINPKNTQAGKYTTIWNNPKDGSPGFGATSLGKRLQTLSKKWNKTVYGTEDVDGFDFKMNLSDKVFRSAVPVMQLEMPRPLTTAAGGTKVILLDGRSKFFGVPCEEPRMADRMPEQTIGRREFHITVLSPPELESLSTADKAKIVNGYVIPGQPRGRGMIRNNIGDFHGYQMEVDWPEAQEFRRSLTTGEGKPLGDKDFHVSLNGGIGDAIAKTKGAPTGDE